MLKLELDGVLAAFSYLGGTIKYLQIGRTELLRNNSIAMKIEALAYAHAVKSVQRLRSIAQDMEMVAARAAAARAEEVLANKFSAEESYGLNQVSAIIDVLNPLLTSFKDEAEARLVVSLSERHASLYDPVEPLFGKLVEMAFPQASEDIAEAGKCIAVEQATAAVFHLMRAMECAVQALSLKLSIPQVEREWGKLLSDINFKISAMPKGSLRDQWSEAHTHLYHVKQAWRNGTMHPKQTYTSHEAAAIFEAVRSFMVHLAKLI